MSIAQHEIGPLAAEVPARPEAAGAYKFIKPVLDIALASILLVLTAPVAIAAMLMVLLTSRGSAIYTQRRVGRGGKEFTIYKIRTMYEDCERESGPTWSGPGDPRVTPVGRVLRSTHLDELPQLFNVFWGDMSLVGPRPYMLQEDRLYAEILRNYADRTRVKPGITGLAQAAGYFGATGDVAAMEKRLYLDILYVRWWSPVLDLQILASTLRWLWTPDTLPLKPSFHGT